MSLLFISKSNPAVLPPPVVELVILIAEETPEPFTSKVVVEKLLGEVVLIPTLPVLLCILKDSVTVSFTILEKTGSPVDASRPTSRPKAEA